SAALAAFLTLIQSARGGDAPPAIPKAWDDAALATWHLPLAAPGASPAQVAAADYYRLKERPIYKSYPVYAPGKEPAGYYDWPKARWSKGGKGTSPGRSRGPTSAAGPRA